MEDSKINSLKFHQAVKSGFQNFCNGTSMHGYAELHQAKNSFWRILWIIVVVASMGITGYQVYQAIHQYNNQSNYTTIEPATNDQIIYPPLKICLSHWIDWVYWYNAAKLGFNKEATLYGLSFITDIYSKTTFDIEQARRQFVGAFQANNFTKLSEFFKEIAIDLSFISIDAQTYSTFDATTFIVPDKIFDRKEFVKGDMKNVMMCHVASSENLKKYFTEIKNRSMQAETRNILQMRFAFSSIDDAITKEEYNKYMAQWIIYNMKYTLLEKDQGKNVDYSTIRPPRLLYPDGFNNKAVDIFPSVDKYLINVKSSGHLWKNKAGKTCLKDSLYITSNRTCLNMCEMGAIVSQPLLVNDCMQISEGSLLTLGLDTPERICRMRIYFIPSEEMINATTTTVVRNMQTTESEQGILVKELQTNESKTTSKQIDTEPSYQNPFDLQRSIEDQVIKAREISRECAKNCTPGCEKWTFESDVSIRSINFLVDSIATKQYTTIRVEYPMDGEVLFMTEVDSRTWEDFIGNVGGLLGIWTGASILSFVQLFYLCCCSKLGSFENDLFFFNKSANTKQERVKSVSPK